MLISGGRARLRQCGFTLVEIIVVIVLLAILAAVAVPRLGGVSGYQAVSLRSTVLGSLKLAQKTALAQHAASVYWVLERPASEQWQIRLFLDHQPGDGNAPTNVSPAPLLTPVAARAQLSFSVPLESGGALSSSLGIGSNLVLMFNQLGDLVRVSRNVNLAVESEFPDSGDAVSGSLQFSDSRGDFCLSLAGYSYESTCR